MQARNGARAHPRCSREQALLYSCEDVAHLHHPTRVLGKVQVMDLVTDICMHEDVDIPRVEFGRRRIRCSASFEGTSRTITFYRPEPTLADVVHEAAHAVSPGGHDMDFRIALVRIARRWAGVQYAALLHHLLVCVGLPMDPWSARGSDPFSPGL